MKFQLKKQLAFAALVLAFSPFLTAQIPKSMRRLPDTGQAQSFTNTAGEDADYLQNPPFFIQNGDGTVTDTVTGLMWQQTDGGEMTFENATTFCENLSIGGHDDWRLPTAQEAYSILNQGKTNPALDGTIFTITGAEYWWTSEADATNANKIWVANAGGGIGNHLKTETVSAGGTRKIHARAVRDQTPPPTVAAHFSDNGDGTITDHLTDLIWQKTPAPDSMSWENALVFAENLSLAGHDDWRLPNIKELQSLNDETVANPSLPTQFFPKIGVKKYWSGTSLPNQTTRAWYLFTRFGITTYDLKTAKDNVLCVRGPEGKTASAASILDAAVQVWPNPFSDKIGVGASDAGTVFELFDCFGRPVFVGKNISEQDFSGQPVGIYFLKILGKKSAMLRLVKI